jgi:Mn2+/Fe2+ NRAMP family transporter
MEFFHIYVVICTLAFFIVLKIFKNKISKDRKTKVKSSNLIFLLFVPILLYITKYINTSEVVNVVQMPVQAHYIKPVSFSGSVISSI